MWWAWGGGVSTSHTSRLIRRRIVFFFNLLINRPPYVSCHLSFKSASYKDETFFSACSATFPQLVWNFQACVFDKCIRWLCTFPPGSHLSLSGLPLIFAELYLFADLFAADRFLSQSPTALSQKTWRKRSVSRNFCLPSNGYLSSLNPYCHMKNTTLVLRWWWKEWHLCRISVTCKLMDVTYGTCPQTA